MTHCLLIAVGGNKPLKENDLITQMRQCVSLLVSDARLSLMATSGLYSTAPLGCTGRQPRFLNAVLRCSSRMPPAELLRGLKRIERLAGRRQRGRNAARPLDLDVIDLGGRTIGWPRRRPGPPPSAGLPGTYRPGARPWLVLPHPHVQQRRFVLEPLLDVAPRWHHPVLKASARQLLARLPRPPGAIRRVLDSSWLSCDKSV